MTTKVQILVVRVNQRPYSTHPIQDGYSEVQIDIDSDDITPEIRDYLIKEKKFLTRSVADDREVLWMQEEARHLECETEDDSFEIAIEYFTVEVA